MTTYLLDGHDLSSLLDTSVRPIRFAEDPSDHIPNQGSIIYSVWDEDEDENFLYVGISGLQKSLERRNPLSLMVAHASGRRSGDQFCIYIHDFFVVTSLVESGEYKPTRGALDKLTKDYIHKNLSYRFISYLTDDSDLIVRNLENKIKDGALGITPTLNGTPPSTF